VAALLPEVVLAVLRVAAEVEVGAERDQVAHPVRPLADDDLDRVAVAEPVAGDQGVVDVCSKLSSGLHTDAMPPCA
jgi:hypothetical protein